MKNTYILKLATAAMLGLVPLSLTACSGDSNDLSPSTSALSAPTAEEFASGKIRISVYSSAASSIYFIGYPTTNGLKFGMSTTNGYHQVSPIPYTYEQLSQSEVRLTVTLGSNRGGTLKNYSEERHIGVDFIEDREPTDAEYSVQANQPFVFILNFATQEAYVTMQPTPGFDTSELTRKFRYLSVGDANGETEDTE